MSAQASYTSLKKIREHIQYFLAKIDIIFYYNI